MELKHCDLILIFHGEIVIEQMAASHLEDILNICDCKINGAMVLVVDAWSLYSLLNIKTNFTKWIKQRIDDYFYSQGDDYLFLNDEGDHGKYLVTLGMARQLCLIENTDKSLKIRRCLVDFELNRRSII